MSALLVILGVLMFIAVIVLIAFIVREASKEQKFVGDIVIRNFMPEYAEGNYKGIYISEKRVGNRTRVKFYPKPKIERDSDGSIIPIKEKKFEPVFVIVKNDLIKRFPRGVISDDSEVWLLPPNTDGFSEDFQKTFVGQMVMAEINNQTTKETALTISQKNNKVMERLLNKTEGGDLFEEYLNLEEELGKEFAKKVIDFTRERRDSSSGGFGTPGSSSTSRY